MSDYAYIPHIQFTSETGLTETASSDQIAAEIAQIRGLTGRLTAGQHARIAVLTAVLERAQAQAGQTERQTLARHRGGSFGTEPGSAATPPSYRTGTGSQPRTAPTMGPEMVDRALASGEIEPMVRTARHLIEDMHNRTPMESRAAEAIEGFLTKGSHETRANLSAYAMSTSRPAYAEAFSVIMEHGPDRAHLLMTDEMRTAARAAVSAQRALAQGVPGAWDASGGSFPVPFDLDPTVLFAGSGSQSPLRSLARVEVVTGKEALFVSSTGVTVSRQLEAAEQTDDSPDLEQPAVPASRVSAFIAFSRETEMDWGGMYSELQSLLIQGKADEEATAFISGSGTAPNPAGILGAAGLSTAVRHYSGSTAICKLIDVQALETLVPPKFRPNSRFLISSGAAQFLLRCQTTVGVPALTGSPDGEMRLLNRPAYVSSALTDGITLAEGTSAGQLGVNATAATSGDIPVIQGDWRNFVIVDRIGMTVERVPFIFGSSHRPTGQAGLWAMWRNGCGVLVENGFRFLKIA